MITLGKMNMWDFLDAHYPKVLESGTDAEIKAAKREYRKLYLTEWRRNRRSKHPEYTISLSEQENNNIASHAKEHNISCTAYLKAAAMAYSNKTYVVPDKDKLARIEQVLGAVYNLIETIAQSRQDSMFSRERDFVQLKKIIEELETRISTSLRDPLTLEELVRKAVANNENSKERILSIIKEHV